MSDLTLMPVFAHPDDESFAGAGALIKYAEEGIRVVLVCATLGERGKAGNPPICTPEELPAVRERELRTACGILGIQQLQLLGYRDQELPLADEAEAVGRIVRAIRAERPQVLYTFPPDGHSGHRDHLAINRLAGLAFRAAGDPSRYPEAGPAWQPAHLYWHVLPGRTPERPDALIPTPGVADKRLAALKAHRSQHLSVERVLGSYGSAYMKQLFEQDAFHLAETVLPRPQQVVADLFAGVR